MNRSFSTMDDYDKLRVRWKEMLVGSGSFHGSDPDIMKQMDRVTETARRFWESMDKSFPKTSLWKDLRPQSDSSAITDSYGRILSMATAYCTEGSELYNRASLKEDILYALEWMYKNVYHENVACKYENWWDWNIGAPLALNNAIVIMYDWLESANIVKYMQAVDHFTPEIGLTGANRIWRATVVGIRGILIKDRAKIEAARDSISQVFHYVTQGDGFYEDGSFVQHEKFPYNGGYGASLLQDTVNLLYLLYGSPWEVTDPNWENVFRWVKDAFAPFIYKGAMMDMVRGREISREPYQDHIAGNNVIRSIVRLTFIAPKNHAIDLKRQVKSWIQSENYQNFFQNGSVFSIEQAKQIVNDPSIQPVEKPSGYRQLTNMDRAVHIRPDYGFGISMYSKRIFNYESCNRENLRGWYTPFGMTYLYQGEAGHYSGNFWPTVDACRLPGTTVEKVERIPGEGECYTSRYSWVGGTSLKGVYGACGMELDGYGSLTARKSWFLFDREIVALGAGISCEGVGCVETIVENRRVSNPVLSLDGMTKDLGHGGEEKRKLQWAHLTGDGEEIGYYFPGTAVVHSMVEEREGRWTDIDQCKGFTNNDTLYRNLFATLWFEHGIRPQNVSYAYVILPNMSLEETQKYAVQPDLNIVENSSQVQAARHEGLKITGANFWEDRTLSSGEITCDRKASIMIREHENEIVVTVSDPTMENTGKIHIAIKSEAVKVISMDKEIEIEQLEGQIRFSVAVKGAMGRSFTVRFKKAGQKEP